MREGTGKIIHRSIEFVAKGKVGNRRGKIIHWKIEFATRVFPAAAEVEMGDRGREIVQRLIEPIVKRYALGIRGNGLCGTDNHILWR